MTQEEETELLAQEMRNANVKLNELWDKVYMEDRARLTRVTCAYQNVKKYIDDIIAAEKEMVDGVLIDIAKRRKSLSELRQIFGLPPFSEAPYPPDSIALLKAFDKDINLLRIRKQAILDKQGDIYKCFETACRRTATPFTPIDGIYDDIVSNAVLNELQVMTTEMETILTERIMEICDMQTECKKICNTLGSVVNMTRDEIRMLHTDYLEPSVVISEELVAQFRVLDEKLKNQHDDWIEEVAFRYDELLVKMNELSKKCNTDMASKYPARFDPSVQSADTIQSLEVDVQALEEKYKRGRPVFDKLNEWMTLWTDKLDVERRVCRTSFYKNRGGVLNSTLKRQKQVQQYVPKLLNELEKMVADYRSKYNEDDLLIDGMMPDQYARSIEAAYHRDKEIQKSQKQILKKGKENAVTNKTLYSKTITGRSVFKPSLVSPAPSSTSCGMSSRKRSLSCSELSCISPTKPPLNMDEPLTSSPKMSTSNNHTQKTTSNCTVTTPWKRPVTPKARAVTPGRPWY